MTKGKRKIAAILAVILAVSATGCSGSQQPSSSSSEGGQSSTSQTESSAAEESSSSGETEEFSMFIADRADAPLSADLPVIAELQKRTNIKINFDIAPESSAAEKFNLMMASGELPDSVSRTIDLIMQYTDKGAFEPLDDLIAEYGPNFSAILEEHPEYKRELAAVDGKIYTFPQIAAIPNEYVYMIRQDWLDKLGLEMPTTLDELVEVFRAFRDGDPNGNGEADEIPFVVASGGETTYGGGTYYNIDLYESFGLYQDFFIEDGEIKYDAIDPRMKEYLTFANMLYAEKLLDPEFLTMDKQQWESRMTNSIGGMTFNWNTRIDIFNTALQQVDPNAQLVGMAPPEGPYGEAKTRHQMKAIRGNGTAIAASSDKKEVVVKFFDYIYSDEGTELMNFGIEGETYTKEGGKLQYTDVVLHPSDGDSPQTTLFQLGIDRLNYVQMAEYEDAFVSDEVRRTRELYLPYITDPYPSLKFTEEEQKEITNRMTEIQTYRDENIVAFIIGTRPLDEFEQFVEELKSLGIEDIIEIHKTAYERYMQV